MWIVSPFPTLEVALTIAKFVCADVRPSISTDSHETLALFRRLRRSRRMQESINMSNTTAAPTAPAMTGVLLLPVIAAELLGTVVAVGEAEVK